MKKLLKERFQQLAGIKPLYETTPREVGEDQIALAAFLQKHKGEVEKAVNGDIPQEYHNKLTDSRLSSIPSAIFETKLFIIVGFLAFASKSSRDMIGIFLVITLYYVLLSILNIF